MPTAPAVKRSLHNRVGFFRIIVAHLWTQNRSSHTIRHLIRHSITNFARNHKGKLFFSRARHSSVLAGRDFLCDRRATVFVNCLIVCSIRQREWIASNRPTSDTIASYSFVLFRVPIFNQASSPNQQKPTNAAKNVYNGQTIACENLSISIVVRHNPLWRFLFARRWPQF